MFSVLRVSQTDLTKQLLLKAGLSGWIESLPYPRNDWPFPWWAWGEEWGGRDKVKSNYSATLQVSSLSCAPESSTGQHRLRTVTAHPDLREPWVLLP